MSVREPPAFPPLWADAWGDDVHGLWAELAVADARQRLRWIEPGTFLMGSPASEPERSGDEGPQHAVRITRGLWLADSACSRALWQAVTGTNPSRFNENLACPVELVSWNDVQDFLGRLAQALATTDATADLPTEAEWEFACRAGTTTAFSFGGNITSEQVNDDGNHPYAGAPKGRDREGTVPVKSLPANAWGLHEMHGNVWEWCADDRRPYGEPDQVAVDPRGPEQQGPEALRAVRGGSYSSFARIARSAFRYARRRGDRDGRLGFRFALRS